MRKKLLADVAAMVERQKNTLSLSNAIGPVSIK